MLRNAFFIGRKDVQYMLRSRETLLWVFVMPIVFFFFIGSVTSQFTSTGGGRKDMLLLDFGDGWVGDVADAAGQGAGGGAGATGERGLLIDQLIRRLEDRDYTVVRADTLQDRSGYRRRLVVPGAFTDSVLAGSPATVRLELEDEGLTGDYDRMRVGRAVYSMLADLVVTAEQGETPSAGSFARLNGMTRTLTVEVTPAGKRRTTPTGFEQAIPGIMVMFVLLVMTTSGAVLLVIERRQGLLRRLASTPISRGSVVIGKWGGKLTLGVIQITFAMLAATLIPIFHMRWGPDLPAVLILMVVYAAMMAALGVLLGSLARTEGQAIGIGVISANVLAALGGCWWPIEITPGWMQALQLFLPTGWAMDGMHKLISFQAGPMSVAPHVLGMAVITVTLMVVTVRRFRWE